MIKWFLNRFRLALFVIGVSLILVAAAVLTLRAEAANISSPVLHSVSQDKPSNDYCLGCHNQPNLSKTLPSGETLSLFIDSSLFNHGVHNQENVACVDCHTNISTFPHPDFKADDLRQVSIQLYTSCQKCHADQYSKVLDSVHQKALAGGNFNAAVCTDCHNLHQQTRITDKTTGELLPEARLRIPQTCARCHSAIYDA